MSNLNVFLPVRWPFAKCSSRIPTEYDNRNGFIHHYGNLKPSVTQRPTTIATATMVDSAERGSLNNYRKALFQIHFDCQGLSISC
jgi:hypothetical protein